VEVKNVKSEKKKFKKKKFVSENGEMHPVPDPNPTTLA